MASFLLSVKSVANQNKLIETTSVLIAAMASEFGRICTATC